VHVVVLGAGISGLTTALTLLEAGADVTAVSKDQSAATTSHLAAAIWFPTSAGPVDRVAAWGQETIEVLADQAERRIPGVIMRESLTLYRQQPQHQPWMDAVGPLREARPHELPGGYSHGLRFTVPLVEMPEHLPWLMRRFVDSGGRKVARRVTAIADLSDLRPDVIVNCAGLAAGALVGDHTTYPVRGQILRVPNPGLTVSVRDEHHPEGRAYVHPRTEDAILGGTLDVGEWDTTPDDDVSAAILGRCTDIVPELAGSQVLDVIVGLRPGRPEIRLEVEHGLVPGTPVVHNYGHGGSGITVGWGCGREAARLALSATAG